MKRYLTILLVLAARFAFSDNIPERVANNQLAWFAANGDGSTSNPFVPQLAASTAFESYSQKDFMLAIQMGLVPGYSVIDKFGSNPDVDTGGAEDVWEFGGLYNYDAVGTAPIAYLSSSSAADTNQTVSVQGLDINGNLIDQAIITDGQNVVTLSTNLWRVFRMENNSSDSPINGILYCHTDPTPTTGVPAGIAVRAIINDGNNQTLMALYTVPRGKVGFILRGELGLQYEGNAAALAEYINCGYYSRRYEKLFKVKKDVTLVVGGSSIYQDVRSMPDIVPALTDIRLTANVASADNMGIFGTLDLLLVDETLFSTNYLIAIGQPGY